MTSVAERHGWTDLEGALLGVGAITFADGGTMDVSMSVMRFAPVVEERRRCTCPRYRCMREATQEDLLCDECREACR